MAGNADCGKSLGLHSDSPSTLILVMLMALRRKWWGKVGRVEDIGILTHNFMSLYYFSTVSASALYGDVMYSYLEMPYLSSPPNPL